VAVRVLHIIDPDHGRTGVPTARLLAESFRAHAHLHEDALVIGGTDAGRMAHAAGLDDVHRIAPATGSPLLALPAFRAFVGRRPPYRFIHAWSIATLALAAFALPGTPRFLTLTSPPTPRAAHWLRMLMHERPCEILVISNAIRRTVCMYGIPDDHVHVLRPGLGFDIIDHRAAPGLRSRWNLPPARRLIGVIAVPGDMADGWRASWILGGMMAAAADVAMVVPPAAHNLMRGISRANDLDWGDRLIVDEAADEPWRLLPACDAALFLGDDRDLADDGSRPRPRRRASIGGILPVLWAMASGVRIVAEAGYATGEVLESGHSADLVMPNDDWAIVQALLSGFDDAARSFQLKEEARREAFRHFSRQRYREDLWRLYAQQISGEPIRMPMPVASS
jgi:hypothetical protein